MELPNPLHAASEALEALLSRLRGIVAPLVCACKKCIYAPFFVSSRVVTRHDFTINYYTYCCVRCGKAKTIPSGRLAKFRRHANISWDNYTDPPRAKVGHCIKPPGQ